MTKTHKGAHREFARLAVNEPRLDPALRRFLPQAYDLKSIYDDELGPDAVVPLQTAATAVETAGHFVDRIASLLGTG